MTGLACVLLLIRQNIWTFPIGLVYAAVTVVVLYHQQLFVNLVENLYYLLMNAYGWYHWSRHGGAADQTSELPVTRLAQRAWLPLVAAVALGTWLVATLFDRLSTADLVYWDSFTTVLCFAAMALTARKIIESWWLWLLADVLYVGLYAYKGVMPYAALYGVYILLAVWGYQAWRRSMNAAPSTSAEPEDAGAVRHGS